MIWLFIIYYLYANRFRLLFLAVVLEVETSKTVAEVKTLVHEKDPSIETSNLIYEEKPLDDTKTLADYQINTNSTLHFAPPVDNKQVVSSQPPTRRKKNRCTFKDCISAPLRGVGDCGFCEGHFCSKHRLLEQHDCVGLQNCKQQLHE